MCWKGCRHLGMRWLWAINLFRIGEYSLGLCVCVCMVKIEALHFLGCFTLVSQLHLFGSTLHPSCLILVCHFS